MVNIPGPPPISPQPFPTRESQPNVYFFLKLSQQIQSLQSSHASDLPTFEEIQKSARNLSNLLESNQTKIKDLCKNNGWSDDRTNAIYNECIKALKLAQEADSSDPNSLKSAQNASNLAQQIFQHIHPND